MSISVFGQQSCRALTFALARLSCFSYAFVYYQEVCANDVYCYHSEDFIPIAVNPYFDYFDVILFSLLSHSHATLQSKCGIVAERHAHFSRCLLSILLTKPVSKAAANTANSRFGGSPSFGALHLQTTCLLFGIGIPSCRGLVPCHILMDSSRRHRVSYSLLRLGMLEFLLFQQFLDFRRFSAVVGLFPTCKLDTILQGVYPSCMWASSSEQLQPTSSCLRL